MDIYDRLNIKPHKKKLREYTWPKIKNFLKKNHVKPYGVGNVTDAFANVIRWTNWKKLYRHYHILETAYQKERYKRNWIQVYGVNGKRVYSSYIGVDEVIYNLRQMWYTVTKDENYEEPQLMTCTKLWYAANNKYISEVPFVRTEDLAYLVQNDPRMASLKNIREQDVKHTCTLWPPPLPSREEVIRLNQEKREKKMEWEKRNAIWNV
jgi:hypothetical protein